MAFPRGILLLLVIAAPSRPFAWPAPFLSSLSCPRRAALSAAAGSAADADAAALRRAPRIWLGAGEYDGAAVAEGATLALSADHAHYLGNVMRLAPGAPVKVFGGPTADEWLATAAAAADGASSGTRRPRLRALVAARVLRRPSDAAAGFGAPPELYFAPIKKKRLSALVEKATELGVAALRPVRTARTEAQALSALAKAGGPYHAAAVEASEQSERLDVPPLRPVVALDEMLSATRAPGHMVYACVERSETLARPLLRALADDAPACASVFVGPEGGFSPDEVAALVAAAGDDRSGVRLASLGDGILRAETAAIAALAVVQAWRGK